MFIQLQKFCRLCTRHISKNGTYEKNPAPSTSRVFSYKWHIYLFLNTFKIKKMKIQHANISIVLFSGIGDDEAKPNGENFTQIFEIARK